MWFFRSFRYLPSPTFQWLAPRLAIFIVYWLFRDMPVAVLGAPISAVGLAVFVSIALLMARAAPYTLAQARRDGVTVWVSIFLIAILIAALLGVVATDDRAVQAGWLIGWLTYCAMFALVVFAFPEEDHAKLPFHWASDHPLSGNAMRILLVRNAIEVAAASYLMAYGTLDDWVVFVSFGRIALYYLFVWIIILMIVTAPDEEP